jgi:NAD(P)-dependent dehydrogenase (short-subunit alcohol dehydrogenase family)
MATFDPAHDIPDLDGKVILLTGGTAGLGLQTLLTIAAHGPSKLLFTGRNTDAAEKTIAQLKQTAPSVAVKFLRCDHASLASVQQAARTVLAETDRLDTVFCVAGIMALPPGLTEDGYEVCTQGESSWLIPRPSHHHSSYDPIHCHEWPCHERCCARQR